MTREEAINEIGDNFESFAYHICSSCTANDWYCPTYCDFLEKLSYLDFEYIIEKYIHYEGDIVKFCRYFKYQRGF